MGHATSIVVHSEDETGLEAEIGGFRVVAYKNHMNAWLGYIFVPKGHAWYGCHYDDIAADVHGGLTFARKYDDGTWQVGFDCAHCYDASIVNPFGEIRTLAYVKRELEGLAAQALSAYYNVSIKSEK